MREGERAELYIAVSSMKKTNRNLRLGITGWTYLVHRIERLDKPSLKRLDLSSGMKVKKKPTMQRVFGRERTTHGKAKVRKSVVWLEPQEQG